MLRLMVEDQGQQVHFRLKRTRTRIAHASTAQGSQLYEDSISVYVGSRGGRGGRHVGTLRNDSFSFNENRYGQLFADAVLAPLCADARGMLAENGRLTGQCCYCGRGLRDSRSISAGYGPTCARHYGLPWSVRQRRSQVIRPDPSCDAPGCTDSAPMGLRYYIGEINNRRHACRTHLDWLAESSAEFVATQREERERQREERRVRNAERGVQDAADRQQRIEERRVRDERLVRQRRERLAEERRMEAERARVRQEQEREAIANLDRLIASASFDVEDALSNVSLFDSEHEVRSQAAASGYSHDESALIAQIAAGEQARIRAANQHRRN